MLKVYDYRELPDELQAVATPYDFYFMINAVCAEIDELDKQIIREVDGVRFNKYNMPISKFTGAPFRFDDLSDGCKTLLSIHNAIKLGTVDKEVFNITGCGANAQHALVTLLAANSDINVYGTFIDFGKGKGEILFVPTNTHYSDLEEATDSISDILFYDPVFDYEEDDYEDD